MSGRSKIRVTAVDLADPTQTGTVEIIDDYVLVAAGSAEITNTQVSFRADGTSTHVITVKGVRRPIGGDTDD